VVRSKSKSFEYIEYILEINLAKKLVNIDLFKDDNYVLSKMIFQRPFKAFRILIFACLMGKICQGEEYSLAERNLLKIIKYEKKFFTLTSDATDSRELSRNAQELVALYEAHLAENPNDTNALILYGKFLNKVGQESHAIGFFLKADSLNPKLAVVKQQIGNFLVENNRPLDALPFFTSAVEINPSVAEYHFHLGNFLHLFAEQLANTQILGKKSIEFFAHECFAKAAEKKPKSFEYRLRFAQSFFDCSEAESKAALEEWNKLTHDFQSILSDPEIDYIKLCRARIMVELNYRKEARLLIEEVSTKSLANSKKTLLNSILKKSKPEKTPSTKQTKKTGLIRSLFYDPHLARLQKVTETLREENLIQSIQADQISAQQNSNGKIRLIVNTQKMRQSSFSD